MTAALRDVIAHATSEREQRLSEQRARAGENSQRQDVPEQQVRHEGNRTPEVEPDPRAGAGCDANCRAIERGVHGRAPAHSEKCQQRPGGHDQRQRETLQPWP